MSRIEAVALCVVSLGLAGFVLYVMLGARP